MQPFIIHDKKRNICAVFDGSEVILTDKTPLIPEVENSTVDEYASLWKTFSKQ